MKNGSMPGYILTLIGGILTLLMSLAILIGFVFVLAGGEIYNEFLGEFAIPVKILWVLLLIIFLFIAIIGCLKIYAANLMRYDKTSLMGGVIALVLGIFTSDPFSLIGGIFGIIEGST